MHKNSCIYIALTDITLNEFSYVLARRDRDQTDHRDGTLWIYGDSVGDLFYKSISKRALCHEIFANCNHTYNWVYALKNMNINQAKTEWDDKDFSIDRIILELDDVLSNPTMNDRSVIIINMGLHYVQGINFTSYKKLIGRTIDLINSHRLSPQGFHGKAIWKTTTALYKERYGDPKTGARHAKGLRFLTVQVSLELINLLHNRYGAGTSCLELGLDGTFALQKPGTANYMNFRDINIITRPYLLMFYSHDFKAYVTLTVGDLRVLLSSKLPKY